MYVMRTCASRATLVVRATIHSYAFFLCKLQVQTHKNSANQGIM